jgi:hypothetical protein
VAEGISGSLQETALTDLLRILSWNGRSGALLLWEGAAEVGLFFDHGRIVRAQMTELIGVSIQTMLLHGGRLNQVALDQARAAFRVPAAAYWPVLRLLAAEGALNEASLNMAQVTAVREAMRQALQWTRGHMQFKPNVPALARAGSANLNVEELLIDGLRTLDEDSHACVTPATVVRWAPSPPAGLSAPMIGQARWQALGACNGQRSVGDVAAILRRDVAVVVEQVQWLLDHGAVLLVPPPTAPVAAAPDDGMPLEDRVVLLLSRFESSWPGGRLTHGKVAVALAKMLNHVAQAYIEHWHAMIYPAARERVWQALILRELEQLAVLLEGQMGLIVTLDREALRDGQVVPQRALAIIQKAAERDPATTLPMLVRLLERALLLLVGEVERRRDPSSSGNDRLEKGRDDGGRAVGAGG